MLDAWGVEKALMKWVATENEWADPDEEDGGHLLEKLETGYYKENKYPTYQVPGLGAVTLVEQHGGEGQGDDAWFVVRVEMLDSSVRLFKKNGYHQSHDGTYYDGVFHEVKATPVMRTEYTRV